MKTGGEANAVRRSGVYPSRRTPVYSMANDIARMLGVTPESFLALRSGRRLLKWQRVWPYSKVWTRRPALVTNRVLTFSDASHSFTFQTRTSKTGVRHDITDAHRSLKQSVRSRCGLENLLTLPLPNRVHKNTVSDSTGCCLLSELANPTSHNNKQNLCHRQSPSREFKVLVGLRMTCQSSRTATPKG